MEESPMHERWSTENFSFERNNYRGLDRPAIKILGGDATGKSDKLQIYRISRGRGRKHGNRDQTG